jgi:hypothetical protein
VISTGLAACSTVAPFCVYVLDAAHHSYPINNFRHKRANRNLHKITHQGHGVVRAASAVALAAVLVAPSALASSAYSRYYVDALYVDNGIESQGVPYQGGHVAIDNAACIGLRRYGVQASSGLDKFWRFRCTLNGADNHTYDVQLSTTTGPKPRLVYPHYLSVKRLF